MSRGRRKRRKPLPVSPVPSDDDAIRLLAAFRDARKRGALAFTLLGEAGVAFEVPLIRDRGVVEDCACLEVSDGGIAFRFNDGEEVTS